MNLRPTFSTMTSWIIIILMLLSNLQRQLAGGHQMDTEGKKRLICDVAYFMESSIGYKNKP